MKFITLLVQNMVEKKIIDAQKKNENPNSLGYFIDFFLITFLFSWEYCVVSFIYFHCFVCELSKRLIYFIGVGMPLLLSLFVVFYIKKKDLINEETKRLNQFTENEKKKFVKNFWVYFIILTGIPAILFYTALNFRDYFFLSR